LEALNIQDVDARHKGERSDAVLRTAMAGHDESEFDAVDIIACAYGTTMTARRSLLRAQRPGQQ
jgi:hypothetical protein